MKTKYITISIGLFFATNILFMYLMISGNWEFFLIKLKWFMRFSAPFIIIYLFYLGKQK